MYKAIRPKQFLRRKKECREVEVLLSPLAVYLFHEGDVHATTLATAFLLGSTGEENTSRCFFCNICNQERNLRTLNFRTVEGIVISTTHVFSFKFYLFFSTCAVARFECLILDPFINVFCPQLLCLFFFSCYPQLMNEVGLNVRERKKIRVGRPFQ